jgi:IS5 family transposase
MTTHLGNPYDGRLLAQSKRNAEIKGRIAIKRILVNRGFRGREIEDAEVLVSYTKGLAKHLKRALRRRQAIEPWNDRMKQDGKLGRCYLKEVVGDQINADLIAFAHNFRTILRKLKLFASKFLSGSEVWFCLDRRKQGCYTIYQNKSEF